MPGTLPEEDSLSDSQDKRVRQEHHCPCCHEETEIPQLRRGVLASIPSTSLLFMDSSSNREWLWTISFPSPSPGPAAKPARAATMRQKVVSLLLCYLLLYACGPVEAGEDGGQGGNSGESSGEFQDPWYRGSGIHLNERSCC